MSPGTKSILFGVHQFAIHPWFVAWAWTRLYKITTDKRIRATLTCECGHEFVRSERAKQ